MAIIIKADDNGVGLYNHLNELHKLKVDGIASTVHVLKINYHI